MGRGTLEALWPSTEHWGRPGALGLGRCKGPQPATCSQPCVHVPSLEGGRPTWARHGCCLSRTAKAGSCRGRKAGLLSSGHSWPCLGPPFPAGLDLPCVDSWFGSCAQSWGYWMPCQEASWGGGKGGKIRSGGEDASPTLSSSSITY